MNAKGIQARINAFKSSVASVDTGLPEDIDAICLEWLENALSEIELRAEREIGLKLLAIIRGIVQ